MTGDTSCCLNRENVFGGQALAAVQPLPNGRLANAAEPRKLRLRPGARDGQGEGFKRGQSDGHEASYRNDYGGVNRNFSLGGYNNTNRVRPVSVGERVKERMEALGISQSELARRVGISQPSVYSLINRSKAGSSHLHKIARVLETTPAYLAGETEDPSEGALPAPTAEDVAEQLDAVLIPEVQISLSMGGGSALDEFPVVQMVPFSRTWLRGLTTSSPEHLMVARGDGDSMMPTILDQDLVIIDRAQQTPRQQDRIWALAYGGWGMIKRLRSLPDGTLQINSDNAAVTPIHAVEGEAHVIGRVVGIVRRI